ncbi:MAG: metal dependent phosphohydrolase [Flavipsychrobacter sp.]|jgi:HD superfamily phosphohydrolase|nr:metal dependent phosphohydrolase [Flavipsychrobacter sp.]
MSIKGKIINDPVYGFIKFPEPELLQIIGHPWFQRLRNIKQMGTAHMVYPGATHTRLHHSLGACHLMGTALDVLKTKGVEITNDEYLGARIAILLHDIGHGPFSHALEHSLVDGIKHEGISHLIMQQLNREYKGLLENSIKIFDHSYPKKYLHQLASSQLDVDRMDYLNRDSFYTGVSEGVIGYDRILQMLTIKNGELMVEEKGVHSVEKFIIARRLMYWQVYLHKTVMASEIMLINILNRAKELARQGKELFCTPALGYFLYNQFTAADFESTPEHLEWFCQLDDSDILSSIKVWQSHEDKVLSILCQMLTERKLFKVILSSQPLDHLLEEKKRIAQSLLKLKDDEIQYFVSTGTASGSTYDINDERIQIAMKNGMSLDISEIDNPVVNNTLASPIHKNYICFIQPEN